MAELPPVALPAALKALASAAGIELSYHDIHGEQHFAPPDVLRALLGAMGFPALDEAAAADSLNRLRAEETACPLSPAIVVRQGGSSLAVPLAASAATPAPGTAVNWLLELEDGSQYSGQNVIAAADKPTGASPAGAGVILPLPADVIPAGYHTLKTLGQSVLLVVAPARCWSPGPESLAGSGRLWGVGAQLYALRSAGNWGMGDLADLADLCRRTGSAGGQTVGVNPLHALFLPKAEDASPYSPNSRLFLNPLYISVEAVAEFAACPEVSDWLATPAVCQELALARAAGFVDYSRVSPLKLKALRLLFDRFAGTASPARQAAFAAFVAEGGQRLRAFAIFQALQDQHGTLPWQQWPAEFRSPQSAAVEAFALAHPQEISWHLWLQFEADCQLAAANAALRAANPRALGLYRDLAVGANSDGADLWIDREAYVSPARFGAPPDDLGPLGQDWGLPPFHPLALRRLQYAPFIAMLRSNMRHAGALRIDHAMSLLHLFWIAPGHTAVDGVYVHYPFDDLLGIIALESHRARCLIIGEDLGTVPDGFRQRMEAENILSYRILYFERYASHLFRRPDTYPALALATATSHDIATIAGHWQGWDIALRHRIGIARPGSSEESDAAERAEDRRLLLAAFQDQGLLPAAARQDADLSQDELEQLITAFYQFLARSPAQVLLVNIDDLAAEITQVNVPGTMSEYPNWRRRLAMETSAIMNSRLAALTLAAIRQEHASPR